VDLLHDIVELMKTIKRVALDAVNAAKPVEVCFGKVTDISPLKILVEQKMILGEAQLVLCRNVTDYNTYAAVEGVQSSSCAQTHPGKGASYAGNAVDKIQITIYNGLAVGDEVVLLRQQGGQKYFVVDRIK